MNATNVLDGHDLFRERIQETYDQEFHKIDRGDDTSVGLRPAGDAS